MRTDEDEAAPPEATAAPETKKSQTKKSATTAPDFDKMTVEELVAAYNEMILTATDLGIKHATTVTMFSDVGVGVKACRRLHGLIQKIRDPQPKKTAAKTKSGSTAKKAQSAPKASQQEEKMGRKAARKSSKARAKATGARTGTKRIDPALKIHIVGKENPKREGSEQHKRFERLRASNGKTVEHYLGAGKGESVTLRHAVAIKYAKVG